MNILAKLHPQTIIICENSYKEAILKELDDKNLFWNLKFYTKKEFFQEYLFSYDEKTIYYLIKKYHFKIEVAKVYLDNLYYLEKNNYSNAKLQFLSDLKKELDKEKLLYYNYSFSEYVQTYSIVVLGYSYLENYERNILNNLKASYIDLDNKKKPREVLEFATLKDEVSYVANQVANLISKGISVNKIKLMNVGEEYYNDLKFYFEYFNIPIKIPTSNNLLTLDVTQKYLQEFPQGYEKVKSLNNDISNKITNIINKYPFVKEENILKDLLTYDFKRTKIDNYLFDNYVELINLDDYVSEDDYVFLINFNAGFIPKTFKDEDYITDDLKYLLKMDNTMVKNKKLKEFTIKKIQSLNNLVITYKLQDTQKDYFPSSLINDLALEVKKEKEDILNSYSKVIDKIKMAKLADEYYKYGTINEDYFTYQNNLEITYNTYDNRFKGIDKKDLREYLNNKLTLSYSSLNNYNKCAFRFYIANILKLDKYEETFEAFVGSLFHALLALNKENINVSEEINNYVNKKEKILTIKERVYLRKLTTDIEEVIATIYKQKANFGLTQTLCEKNIIIDKSKDMQIYFTGFVDKILYQSDEDKTLVAIIDYKTGNVSTKLNYLLYGLNLQLPIYLYLVKKSTLFKNPVFVGFYLQFILNNQILRDIKKDYQEVKKDNLKLQGYSNSNISIISRLDKNYQNSSLISSLKINNDGNFSKNAKVLSNEEMDKIIALTEKNIDDNIAKITEGKFPINPKKIGYENDIGCEYCHFKDLCFKKNDDYEILEEINSLNFLGGDDLA